ncbi:BTB/POZ protein [Paraphysoderma sedebokerense]|nr:BTB/POZ protein [Paraphysoderma sedebokerense]
MFLFSSSSPLTTLPIPDSDRIDLNIGGTIFHTTKSTLSKRKGVLSDLVGWVRDNDTRSRSDGRIPCYFIDRDPKHFLRILNYLRTDKFLVDLNMDSYNLHELKIEAGYYGLEELVSGIQGLIDKRTKTNTTLQPSKRLIIRIHYPDPTKDLLKIDPYPLPSFIKYDLDKLTKAFAEGLEAMGLFSLT